MSPPDNNKPLILIVDDNPTNLDVLIELLQEDYQLSVAKSGQKALAFVQRFKPCLILLDIVMPEMDGFEVCRMLKSSPETRDIPIIFISSATNYQTITTGFEIGGADYLNKPFIPLEVRKRIHDQLILSETESK